MPIKPKTLIKIVGILIIFFFAFFLLSRGHIFKKSEVSYGVTFSKAQAASLGLDWREVYQSLLNDLKVKKLRLSAYWNEIETAPGEFYWSDLDWLIETASSSNASVILAIGGRLPRWPECHFPAWTDSLYKSEREAAQLNYIKETINHYRANKNIIAWQIENEPFLNHFGVCPELDPVFLDQEIALVHKLDERSVMLTDSGELSTWVPAAKRADIFGTTMYLDTYSSHVKSYIHYPITPDFFQLKRNLAGLFAHPQDWLVIELQAEPWGPIPFQNLSPEERAKTMDLSKFRNIIEFSRQAGFKEFYLWGAEWWYWEKIKQNNPAVWEEAKKLFKT